MKGNWYDGSDLLHRPKEVIERNAPRGWVVCTPWHIECDGDDPDGWENNVPKAGQTRRQRHVIKFCPLEKLDQLRQPHLDGRIVCPGNAEAPFPGVRYFKEGDMKVNRAEKKKLREEKEKELLHVLEGEIESLSAAELNHLYNNFVSNAGTSRLRDLIPEGATEDTPSEIEAEISEDDSESEREKEKEKEKQKERKTVEKESRKSAEKNENEKSEESNSDRKSKAKEEKESAISSEKDDEDKEKEDKESAKENHEKKESDDKEKAKKKRKHFFGLL